MYKTAGRDGGQSYLPGKTGYLIQVFLRSPWGVLYPSWYISRDLLDSYDTKHSSLLASLVFYVMMTGAGCDSTDSDDPDVPEIDYTGQYTDDLLVETYEAFEFYNVVITLTGTAGDDRVCVNQEGPYYADVQRRFGAFQDHPLLDHIDSFFSTDVILLNNGCYASVRYRFARTALNALR